MSPRVSRPKPDGLDEAFLRMDRHPSEPDELGFVRTAVIAPAFTCLRPIATRKEGLVDLNIASWNQIANWLGRLEALGAIS